jgi:hypothetical protein
MLVSLKKMLFLFPSHAHAAFQDKSKKDDGLDFFLSSSPWKQAVRGGDLDKFNPNLKQFQIINHRRNYFKKITPFCIAIHGGDAEDGATPGGVARRWRPRRHGGARSR